MAIYVPIVMYGLRMFIVVLQELYCLPNCLHTSMIRVRGFYHITKFCYSIPSHCNVWPEVVYCFFYKNYIVYQLVYMLV